MITTEGFEDVLENLPTKNQMVQNSFEVVLETLPSKNGMLTLPSCFVSRCERETSEDYETAIETDV